MIQVIDDALVRPADRARWARASKSPYLMLLEILKMLVAEDQQACTSRTKHDREGNRRRETPMIKLRVEEGASLAANQKRKGGMAVG